MIEVLNPRNKVTLKIADQMIKDYKKWHMHLLEICDQADFVGKAIAKVGLENWQISEIVESNKRAAELIYELSELCDLLKKAERKLKEYILYENTHQIENLFDLHESIKKVVKLTERKFSCLLLTYLEAFEKNYGLRNELIHLT